MTVLAQMSGITLRLLYRSTCFSLCLKQSLFLDTTFKEIATNNRLINNHTISALLD